MMQQILTACLAVAGLAFTSAYAGFAADMAVPPLIAPAAALMVVLKRRREFYLAAACALALTSVAGATDLPFKMPIFETVPAFNWTGVYLGIGGGTGWGSNEYTWNQDATLAAIASQMQNPGQLPLVGATQGSVPISGGFFGGQLGGNWQVERAVFGIGPTLIGLTSRATAVASMQVQLPPRVSVLAAMIRFRASAPSRVVSVQQSITR